MKLFQIFFHLIFIIYLVDGNHRGKCESLELIDYRFQCIWLQFNSAHQKEPVSRHHKTLFPQVFTLSKDTENQGSISRNIN